MFISADGGRTGSLSSGCIDADVALHARTAYETGEGRKLRYGEGSPFWDIRLPCGGGLDILIMPMPSNALTRQIRLELLMRRSVRLYVGFDGLSLLPKGATDIALEIVPDTRFVVYGKGREVTAFAHLATNAGFETLVASPEHEETARSSMSHPENMPSLARSTPPTITIDAWTACLLFFHNHDDEPDLLRMLLASDAFYIGAQGSLRTASKRAERLRAYGVPDIDVARVRGPIGLIPSTRDPRTLAVSVLAEVLLQAQTAK
jgi:xanthine dehydrogenase accessory factor